MLKLITDYMPKMTNAIPEMTKIMSQIADF